MQTNIATECQGQIHQTYTGQRSTWNAQLKYVTNKAYRVFWTFRGTSGKAWDLKPKVVYWTYTMVIRPMLTYASTVQWPVVRYKVSRVELSRLQRSATRAITRAIRMDPTAAMEVLLGPPPLHVTTEADAQVGIHRLMCTQQ